MIIRSFFFFLKRETSSKWRRGGRGPSLSLLFPGNGSPSSSLNSGAHLHFNSVLSKTIYSMGNRPSMQNKRQTTSEGEVECSTIYDRTNYHIWSLFSTQSDGSSRQSDGLMQLDPSLKDNFVLCNGAFSDTKGNSKCSLCFLFLVISCLIAFVSIQQGFFLPFQI